MNNLKYTFPAIKAMFTDKKVRKFVGKWLFISLVISLFVTIFAEMLIYTASDRISDYLVSMVSFR